MVSRTELMVRCGVLRRKSLSSGVMRLRLARQEKTQIFAEKQSPCPGPAILSDPDSSCSSPSGNSSGDEFPTTPKRPRTEQVGFTKLL